MYVLYKMSPISNYLVLKFINVYKPQKQLSLDEGIILYIAQKTEYQNV